jgi:MFS family permease
VSLVIELAGYLVLALNTARSPAVFVVTSGLLTLGSAGPSACNSLALAFLPHQREAGRLFGGIAVLQAISSNLLAPLLFSNTFAAAVSSPAGWVEVIFYLACGIIVLAATAFAAVRVPRVVDDAERGRSVGRGRA